MMERDTKRYVVVGSKPWNRRIFEEQIQHYPGKWHFIDSRAALTREALTEIDPRYIFFLHWSYKVPQELFEHFECVCFHMTDVPFGRGGSPLQNLIVRGVKETKVTALRMVEAFDAGPVYGKRPLSIASGAAEEIFVRATQRAAQMIEEIIREEPVPVAQEGDVVAFKRRRPAESEIPALDSLEALYDFVRMLDAEGYPKAFFEREGVRYEFSRVVMYEGQLKADVTLTLVDSPTETNQQD